MRHNSLALFYRKGKNTFGTFSTESNTRYCFIWNSGFKTVDYVQPKMTERDLMLPHFHNKSYTHPELKYCVPIWIPLSKTNFNRTERFYGNPHTNLFYYKHYCLRPWLYGKESGWFKFYTKFYKQFVFVWMLFLNTEINRKKTNMFTAGSPTLQKEMFFN